MPDDFGDDTQVFDAAQFRLQHAKDGDNLTMIIGNTIMMFL